VANRRWIQVPFDLITVALFMAMTTAVVGSLLRVERDDRYTVLLPLGFAGALCGYFLARYQISDYLAHSIALWMGLLACIFAATTIQTSWQEIVDSNGGVYRGLLQNLVREVFSNKGETIQRNEMIVALGMVSWLVAYTATWIYVRRGWFWLSIAGPAVVMLVALRLDHDQGTWQVALFLISAICLAARNTQGGWQAAWTRRQVPVARGLVRKLTALVFPVATVAVLVALVLSPIVHDFVTNNLGETLKNSWSGAVSEVSRYNPRHGPAPQAYNTFGDEVESGEHLELSDDVFVRAKLDGPRYLRVRTYNMYTGHSLESDITETFDEGSNSDDPVTKVTYQPEQSVAISFSDLATEEGTITVVLPMGASVPVIDQFTSASDQVYALMGWQQISEDLIVSETDPDSVPIDLHGLIASLNGKEFATDPKTGEVALTVPSEQAAYERRQGELAGYPVVSTLGINANGELVVHLEGRLPVYDDIEKVLTKADGGNPGTYSVVGSTSAATVEQLQTAGADYPQWVIDRYSSVPDSVTDRTRRAAEALVADFANPYDQATAIQNWLRTSFGYEENSPKPPNGQDFVDYFLFEHQAGRCEQFAQSMLVLLRSAGIPSRVVTGFRQSDEQDDDGEYLFRGTQSHQWIEVYFPTYGWVEFEPTAGQNLFARSLDSQAANASPTPEPESSLTPIASPSPEATPEPTVAASPIPPALDVTSTGSGGSPRWTVAVGVFVAALGVTLAVMALNWLWKIRGLSPAGSLMFRLQRVGTWFGIHPSPSTTPAEYASRFGQRFPTAGPAAKSISDAYYHEQFGPTEGRTEAVNLAGHGWARVRSVVWRSPFHRRLRRKGTRRQ
jgi:transglutaminase-like putative cysteine protease